MEVNLITTKFKEFNRGLNLLIILLSFMVLLFLISQWLPESAIANRISAILILLVCVVIILAFFFLIIRNMNKETKIIDASQVKKMTINSGEDVDGIKGYNEIGFCGNFIELVNSDQLYEIDNKSAFMFLSETGSMKVYSQKVTLHWLDASTTSLLKDGASILHGW